MTTGNRSELLLKIRQIASSRSIVTFNRQHSADKFLQLIDNPSSTPQSIAKEAARDPNLASTIIALANKTRRDLKTKPINSISKAVVRIGRLGCSEAMIRMERAKLMERSGAEWVKTANAMQTVCDAAIQMARKRTVDKGSADMVDAIFLTTLYSAGVFIQIFAANELDMEHSEGNRRMVVTMDPDVTTLTLQALKVPADVVSRVNQIGINKADIEGMLANDVWRSINAKLNSQ